MVDLSISVEADTGNRECRCIAEGQDLAQVDIAVEEDSTKNSDLAVVQCAGIAGVDGDCCCSYDVLSSDLLDLRNTVLWVEDIPNRTSHPAKGFQRREITAILLVRNLR